MSRGYAAKGIRERIRPVRLDEAYRSIHRRHQERPLGTIPTPSRFSDPPGHYSVLYATQSMRCAVWEGLARDRFARRRRRLLAFGEVEPIVVVTLHAIEPLSLVDLRHDGPVRIGAPTAVTHDADHRAGQSLSAATYANVPEADGFMYQSRFTGHMCMAVFDRAMPKLAVRDVTGLVQHPKFADVLIDYEITLRSTERQASRSGHGGGA